MEEKKQHQIAEAIQEAVARFISEESNRTSLITITNVSLSPDARYATIFITVLPDTQEQAVLDFLNRRRSDMRTVLKKRTRIGRIPNISIAIDRGEKHRQRIDILSHEIEE